MRQEMGWHDKENSADLVDRLLAQMDYIQPAFNTQWAHFTNPLTIAVSAFFFAMTESWKLTLTSISIYPMVFGAYYWASQLVSQSNTVSERAFVQGAQVASEDIGLIRTIWTFCTQGLELRR